MKTIHRIDIAIIGISIVALLTIIGYTQPQVIAPLDGHKTTKTNILFEIEQANTILIDENKEFTSPKEYYIEDGLTIELKPGTYYWKAKGIGTSNTRTLTVQTLLELELRKKETEETYEVRNKGNTNINVKVYDKGTHIETLKLQPTQKETTKGTHIQGELQ